MYKEEMKIHQAMSSRSRKAVPSKGFGGPFIDMEHIALKNLPSFTDDAPSVADSDVSSLTGYDSEDDHTVVVTPPASPRSPLQWDFHGLTLWLEYEEFDRDLSRAIDHASKVYGIEPIPIPHSTVIYGMLHLTQEEAIEKLAQVPHVLQDGRWPEMEAPKGLTCDIAQEGKPGQVCTIAWAELTLRTNEKHEEALDAVHELFGVTRKQGLWTPHISLAYDNPEDSVLSMVDFFNYVMTHVTLLKSRRVKAVSLWDTNGKMSDWHCLDRLTFSKDEK